MAQGKRSKPPAPRARAALGHDPRNSPGAEPRAANKNPGSGKITNPDGLNGNKTRDLFSAAANEEGANAREWREEGRQLLSEWFKEPPPEIPKDRSWVAAFSENGKLENLLDGLYINAAQGSIQAATRLLEYRLGRPMSTTEARQTISGDGVGMDKAAKEMLAGMRSQLEAAGVDTTLLDKTQDEYLWAADRADEYPPEESAADV